MKNAKASLLVVEDDPAILRGLLDVFVFNGYAAAGAADGDEGLSRALAEAFDLILLDVMLPSRDGFSVCREIRCKKPEQPILMLTAKGSEDDVVTGFQAGADDYVCKPFSLRELMVRVEALLRRAGKIQQETPVAHMGLVFDPATLTVSFDRARAELTRREMDLVAYLHRRKGRIVSKRELLSEIWKYGDADIETRTVDIHIQKLRKKIAGLSPRFAEEPSLIQTVRGEGWRMAGFDHAGKDGA